MYVMCISVFLAKPALWSIQKHAYSLEWLHIYILYLCIILYSLAPGVSFDLLQHLYKLEHPTVLCCSASIRYMHCGPDICTAGLSVMITSGPQAINQL